MRVLVIGAGAVGGFLGGRLVESGADVTFLVREKRAEQLRRDGLRLVTPEGETALKVKTISAAELAARASAGFELVLLSLKAYALEQSMEDFAPAVRETTAILPMLNGMRHMDVLTARFGAERVLGGATRISTDLDAEGRVLQLAPFDDVFYGETDGAMTPRLQAVDALFRATKLQAEIASDIMAMMWAKWAALTSLGAIPTLSRGALGELATVRGGREFGEAVLQESQAIAEAHGYPPPPIFLATLRKAMADPQSKLVSSMYRDLVKGQPVEADHILGDYVERGRAKGVACPLLNAAYIQLCVYEQARKRKSV